MTPKDVKALKPLPVAASQCPICKTLYSTYLKAEGCAQKCGWEAYRNDLTQRKEAKRRQQMNWVRENATSLPHAIELLKEYCSTLRIKLDIKEYPDSLGDISNTHNAPLNFKTNSGWEREKNGLPESYPGFEGRWEGKIRGKCPMKGCWDKNKVNLTCLFEHIVSGFHDGTGCAGNDFSIGGSIFLYDFPKIMTQGGLIKTLFHIEPRMKNLQAMELAYTLSPKLLEAANKLRGNPIDLKIEPYLREMGDLGRY